MRAALRILRGAACLICCALVVLLVPSSAWSADTAGRQSSGWSSPSRGSSSEPLTRKLPADPQSTEEPQPEPSGEPSPTLPDESESPSSSDGPSPDASPSPSPPATFSDEQIVQLEKVLEPQFAAMAEEPATACGYDTHPPCETRMVAGQWDMVNEYLAVAATALSVLVLVGLTRLIGGWGRRDR